MTLASSDLSAGIVPDAANWRWYSGLTMIFSRSSARSWCSLLVGMPRFDPPRKTGAVSPAVMPGIANTPMLASMSGQPSSGLMI